MRKFAVLLMLLAMFCIHATPQNRIISLAPNITEIIYALGCSDNLIGRSSQCNYPAECTKIENIGNPWKPNIEKILLLKPDIVIASSLTDDESIKTMKKAGLRVYRVNFEDSFDGVYDTINEIGKLLDKESNAQLLIQETKETVNLIKSKTDSLPEKKKAVYLMSWSNGVNYAATGNTFIDGIIKKAGLVNIAETANYWVISNELLISQKPDIVFIPSYNSNKSEINKLNKILKSSEIKVIDGDMIERQGSRTKDITLLLSKTAYPDLYE